MTLFQAALNDKEVPRCFLDRYIQPSLKSSDYLLHLVNGILDYTQISINKKPTILYERVNIADVIAEVIDLLQMKADIRKIKLCSYIDPQLPKIFFTDPRRLKQILINLIGNAAKFTFEGYIKVSAKLLNKDDNNEEKRIIKISVEDSGIGIRQEN